MNKTVFDFQFDLPKIESWSVLAVGTLGAMKWINSVITQRDFSRSAAFCHLGAETA